MNTKHNDHSFYDILVQRRWWFAIASLIIIIVTSAGLPKLGFNFSFRVFFSEDSSYLKSYDALKNQFPSYNNIIFASYFPQDNFYNEANIESLQNLAENAELIPFVFQVNSVLNATHVSAGQDDIYIEPVFDKDLAIDPDTLQRLRNIILNDPLLIDRMTNKKGNVVITIADLSEGFSAQDYPSVEEVIGAAQRLKSKLIAANPDHQIFLLGSAMNSYSIAQVTQYDLLHLFPLVFLAAFVISYAVGRSFSAIFASNIVIVVSVTSAMGIAGWMGFQLNVVSSMASLLIVTLALADTVHVGSNFIKELKPGVDKLEAIRISLQTNFRAILLTSITTIAGFYSLNFLDSDAFSDMGNIAIIGVITAFVYSVTLFPALIILFNRATESKGLEQKKVADAVTDFALKHQKPMLILFVFLTLTTAPFIVLNQFNDNYLKFFEKKMEIRQGIDMLGEQMRLGTQIEYSFQSNTEGGANDPEFLRAVDDFTAWYKQQPNVTSIQSYVNFIKHLNQKMHNDDPSWYRIPETQELAAQYQLLYQLSAPTDQLITTDNLELRLIASLDRIDNQTLLAHERRVQQWLQTHQPSLKKDGISVDIMFAHAGEETVNSMKIASLATILLITLSLIIGLGSLKYGLISLIPNLFPPLVVYGVWGIFIRDMNQAAAVTYSISLGLIIDDTVHILSKYVEQRKIGVSPEDAIRYSLENTLGALFLTTLMIGSGLTLLSFASFKPNAELGYIMTPIITLALLFDVFMLPGILLYLDKKFITSKQPNDPSYYAKNNSSNNSSNNSNNHTSNHAYNSPNNSPSNFSTQEAP